jgi:uncharacterized protein YbjT (DUF2867 family)
MILVAGGTGMLGTEVVRLLLARGLRVRVLTRDAQRADHLKSDGVEIVVGDVREAAATDHATAGIETVVSAIHGFVGPGGVSPETVDHLGNHNLIQAAQANGVGHFVLMSVVGADPNHPMELHRMKYLAERELQASHLAWTIIRATPFMELWAQLIGVPILKNGKTMIFGRGENPINFVSVQDVARFVELAVVDTNLRGAAIDVGGPENLTANQVAQVYAKLAGGETSVRHVPLPVMRLASVLLRPLKPDLARQIRSGVVMDTKDMRFDAAETRRRFASIPLTSFAEVARRDSVSARGPADR